MKNKNNYEPLLPCGNKLFNLLTKTVQDRNFKKILVIGESSETLAVKLSEKYSTNVELIVEDYNSLLNAKLALEDVNGVIPKIMEFERTDYNDNEFDLIFAQTSLTRENRKKIVKEIKRILRTDGIFALAEIVMTVGNPPKMITEMLDWAGMSPLFIDNVEKYYSERNFETIASETHKGELSRYYKQISALFDKRKDELSDEEKSYYKKLINRINHEANVFLKFGGEKYLTCLTAIMKLNK